MAKSDNDDAEQAGVLLTGFRIRTEHKYIFREQKTSDYGVDGHVETRLDGVPTGRLIGVQIKSGPSYFKSEKPDGWIFRPEPRHITYWLAHSLPMYLLLVDLESQEIYWQVLDEMTILTGDRGGRYVFVPKKNTFSTVMEYFEQSANDIGRHARASYTANLNHLPPSVGRKLRSRENSSPTSTAWLATHLSQGRTAPELAVQTLLTNKPNWLQELESDGWLALANYAMYHGLGRDAAEAYDLASRYEDTRSGQLAFSAGIALIDEDPDKAKSYFVEAKRSNDLPQLGWLGMELIRLRADASSPQDPELDARLTGVADHPSILMFRAEQSAAGGELDDAISLLDRALSADPENDSILTTLATELHKRAQTSARRLSDVAKATELATLAVEQLHRCAGPSVRALEVLLHILLLQHNFAEILNRALPPPSGQATPDEASSPQVVIAAALAADDLGLEELADQLIDHLTESIQRDFLRASLSKSERLPAEERRRLWERIVDNLDTTHPRELVVGVTRLAYFGVDRSAELDALVHAQLIPAETRVLVTTVAAAVSNPEVGLPPLRALADTDQAAAQSLIQVLEDLGQTVEAIQVAGYAFKRLREPRFALLQAEMLFRNGSYIEAREVIESALASPSLSESMRPDTHAMLARIAARSQDWNEIEQHCEAALSASDPALKARFLPWLLVESQVRQGAHGRAMDTIQEFDLNPETSSEIHVWAAAVTSRPLDDALATKLLDLADVVADDAVLSGDLIAAVISRTRDADEDAQAGPYDERAVVAAEIRRRAFEAVEAHIDAHGPASRIRRLRFDTVDDLVNLLREQLEPSQRLIRETAAQVLQGDLPVGLYASAIDKSVSYVLVTQALGLYIAASFLEPDCTADESGVLAGFNNDVVVDTSALIVASLIGDFSTLRGQFRSLLMTPESIADSDLAQGEIAGLTAASGHLGWDPNTDKPVYAAPNVDYQLHSIQRLKLLQSATSHVLPTSVDGLPTFAELTGADGREAAWLSPIELAKSHNLVLWSDDVALRKVARSVGVSAFGTVSLLEQLAEKATRGIADDDQESVERLLASRRAEVIRAIKAGVVDVPIEIDHLVGEATNTGYPVDLAHYTVGRAAWWHWSPSRYHDINKLLTPITDPVTAEVWRTVAMNGAASLSQWDPTQAGGLVALVALAGRGPTPDASEVASAIIVGEEIAKRHEAASPLAVFPKVAAALEQLGAIKGASQLVAAVEAVRVVE